MRILFVVPYFAPAWAYGGPPRLTYDMARHLVRRGHDVHILTTDALDGDHRVAQLTERMDGISVRRVRNVSNFLAWRSGFLPLGLGAIFERELKEADVVHLFDFRSYLNLIAISVLARSDVPFVLSALGELPRATGLKRYIKTLYDQLFGYRMLRDAGAVIAQTEDEAGWYQRFRVPRSHIRLVPLGVDLDDMGAVAPKGAFREQLRIGSAETMILFLGRLHQYKGIAVLITAFARIAAERGDVRLVIAGRDEGFQAEAEQLAAKLTPSGTVFFPGGIYGHDRFTAYRDADIFAITSSHFEQTSLAALEACACGTPVVVTEQAPIPGLDQAGAGITVPYGVESVTQALSRLVEAPDERALMGERAAQLVRDQFNWPRVIEQLERVYDELLAHKVA